MPVTSRSKRLRGATTASQHNNKIAYTDRKTRSASSSLITSIDNNTIPTSKSENPSELDNNLVVGNKNVCVDGTDPPETKVFISSSSEGKCVFKHEAELCAPDINPCEGGDESILSETVKPEKEVPSVTNNFTIESIASNKATATTSTSSGEFGSSDWNPSATRTNELSHCNNDIRETEKVIEQHSERQCEEVKSHSFKSDVVVENSSRKRSKLNDQKLTLAPMLLMNNLPYMGELTFDTRPRRGRKPKKADICHLISKNYGIHFPNSYTNVPNTGSPVSTTTTTTTTTYPYPSTPKIRTKAVGPSVKGKPSSKRNSSSTNKSGGFSTCPQSSPQTGLPTWTISPPDLLPISMSGRNRNISSSYVNTTGSLSLNKTHQQVSSNSSIKSIKMKNQPSPSSMMEKGISGQDEPLNLCMRDSSSQMKSPNRPNLSDFNANYAGIMNLKLPLTSPNSLFSDFHLNQVGSRTSHTSESASMGFDDRIGRKSRNPPGGGSGHNNTKGNSSDKTISDLSLVNNLNLNLANNNNYHGDGPILTKARGKMSHALRFVPPLTVDTPGFNKSLQSSKKGRKRRSPTLKPDDSNQMDIKSPLLAPSTSSNIFLNSSSVHPSSSAVSNIESHAGGCLFGQSDSGMNSSAQVSICKFKFTGGAKPSLQEKKMLSVDSGGNFRFYTDKCGSSSIKSLKNCNSGNNQGSSASFNNSLDNYGEQDRQYAFSALPKSAKSMSVCMPVRPSSSLQTISTSSSSPVATTSSSSRLVEPQKSPPIPSVSPTSVDLHNLHLESNPCKDGYSSSQSDNSNSGAGPLSESACGSGPYQTEANRRTKLSRFKRKRRTRKSLMREKLEKTFKEKGFLIQTQQLESAEGATYCKFRQLRKFTRYLFRSWKDYLPDNVRDINAPGANKGDGSGAPINLATTSAAGGNPEGGESGSGMEMELDLSTTNNSQDLNSPREEEDSSEDEENEDCEEGIMDSPIGILTPEVTLTTQPSSPVKTPKSNNSNNDDNNHPDEDSEVSNDDVDVENIDGTSDNSSLPYNPNIRIKQEDNEDDTNPDSTDTMPD